MSPTSIDLKAFIIAMVETVHGSIKQATDGLMDEQLYYQPTNDTNSIAWLAWHLCRVQDGVTARISGEAEVWRKGGWAERFGRTIEANGIGDTPEQVAAFRPARDLLLGYSEATHNAMCDRIERMPAERLDKPVAYLLGDTRPAWEALRGMVGDSKQHIGQINYLHGMIAGSGWLPPNSSRPS